MTITNPGIYIYTNSNAMKANTQYVNEDGFLILFKFPDSPTAQTQLTNSELANMLNTHGIVFDWLGNIWDADTSSTSPLKWTNPFVSPQINANLSFNTSWTKAKTANQNLVCANNTSANPFYSNTIVPYPRYFVSSTAMPNANYTGLDYFNGWLLEQINGETSSPSYQLLYNPMNRQERLNDTQITNANSLYQNYCNTVQFQDPICYCAPMTKFQCQTDIVESVGSGCTGSKIVPADYCLYSYLDNNLAGTSSNVDGRTLGQGLLTAYTYESSQNSGSYANNYQNLAGQCNCGGFCDQLKSNLLDQTNATALYQNVIQNFGKNCSLINNVSFTACLDETTLEKDANFNVTGNVNIQNKCPSQTPAPSPKNPNTPSPSPKNPTSLLPGTKDPTTLLPGTQNPTTLLPGTQNPTTLLPGTQNPGTGLTTTGSITISTNTPSTTSTGTTTPSLNNTNSAQNNQPSKPPQTEDTLLDKLKAHKALIIGVSATVILLLIVYVFLI